MAFLDEQPVETTLYSLEAKTPLPPPERRTGERHLSLLRVGSLMIGDRRELCLIRNISDGGMLIRPYCPIPAGTAVEVELKHGQQIRGTAIWTRHGCVGVSFDRPIDVLGLLSASADGPRPRMPRIEVNCVGWVREDGSIHRVKVLDLSQGGAKIESGDSLTTGAEVTMTVNGLAPIAGSVRWRDGKSYGITFNRVLALPVLVAWLQNQRTSLRAAS